jgi:hypothetical protein
LLRTLFEQGVNALDKRGDLSGDAVDRQTWRRRRPAQAHGGLPQ